MKKLLSLSGIFIFLVAMFSPAAAGYPIGSAQDGGPAPQEPDFTSANNVFLPAVMVFSPSFTLSGQVKDAGDMPLSGVAVVSDFGGNAVSDANGVYHLDVAEGAQKIVAAKDGYNFDPATANLNVANNMNNLNFTAIDANAPSVAACFNMLLDSNFETGATWTISPAVNPSVPTSTAWYSPVTSMLSGVPVGAVNPFPGIFTTGEFWQPTSVVIPANAYLVNLQMRLLPRSSDYWGYHLDEQAAMDAESKLNAPDAVEAQYGHIRDAANTVTLRQLFKWFPIDSYYWLYRSYDLTWPVDFRGQTISVLFGATNNGYGGNAALYVDDVYLYYCTP